jgi:hypothetical protein
VIGIQGVSAEAGQQNATAASALFEAVLAIRSR